MFAGLVLSRLKSGPSRGGGVLQPVRAWQACTPAGLSGRDRLCSSQRTFQAACPFPQPIPSHVNGRTSSSPDVKRGDDVRMIQLAQARASLIWKRWRENGGYLGVIFETEFFSAHIAARDCIFRRDTLFHPRLRQAKFRSRQ